MTDLETARRAADVERFVSTLRAAGVVLVRPDGSAATWEDAVRAWGVAVALAETMLAREAGEEG